MPTPTPRPTPTSSRSHRPSRGPGLRSPSRQRRANGPFGPRRRPEMQRLEALGAHSLAHRRGRSVLTALGIVLGVAVLFGVLVTSDAVNRAFQDLVRSYTGPSDVSMGPAGACQSRLAPG